jgi:alpha-1,3-rhamnosyl/mannosyltransferase
MRILINALLSHGPRSGVGHYTAELLRCLPGLLNPDEQVIARPRPWVGTLRRWLRPAPPRSPRALGVAPRQGWRSGLTPWLKPLGRSLLRWHLSAVARLGRFDLYHEPNYLPAPCRAPTVATIHDLSVVLHPQWHPAERVAWFERHFPLALRQCVHYFTDSEAARREIVQVLGVPGSRVTRTYSGIRPGLRPRPPREVRPTLDTLGLPPRYLLHVGTIEPRKNVLTLLRAYCDLPASLRETYPLVLVGGWGWRAEEVAAYFEETARHRGVMRLGYVPDEALGALYNGARALAFPSVYEGFGLPPVEMMACGGAVLASTADAVAEVAGRQAQLLDPHDVAAWRDALTRVLSDDDYWKQLRRGAVEHARPFTWERCAADTLRVYREVARGNFDCAEGSPLRVAG